MRRVVAGDTLISCLNVMAKAEKEIRLGSLTITFKKEMEVANSDWVFADKQCQKSKPSSKSSTARDLFEYVGSQAGTANNGGQWQYATMTYDFVTSTCRVAVYLTTAAGHRRVFVVSSLEDLQKALVDNSIVVPVSLQSIVDTYAAGKNGRAALNFYIGSGEDF